MACRKRSLMTIAKYFLSMETEPYKNNQSMKMIRLFIQIAFLFIFYYIGEWLQQTLNLVIPGSVIGMILLFLLLVLRIIPAKWVDGGSNFLTGILPLLFVPICVGIMNYPNLFSYGGSVIITVIFISTLMTLAITGAVSQLSSRRLIERRMRE